MKNIFTLVTLSILLSSLSIAATITQKQQKVDLKVEDHAPVFAIKS